MKHPVIGGVTEPALDHGIGSEAAPAPDRLTLHRRPCGTLQGTRARPVVGVGGFCGVRRGWGGALQK